MNTITINGRDYVPLNDICDILRCGFEFPASEDTETVLKKIARLMFHDEFEKAETVEEGDAACEMPGEFVLYKDLGHVNPNGKTRMWFTGFVDKTEARATDCEDNAVVFKYKSMANHVAEILGKGWTVLCIGEEYQRIVKRFLARLFGEESEDEDEAEDEDEEQ